MSYRLNVCIIYYSDQPSNLLRSLAYCYELIIRTGSYQPCHSFVSERIFVLQRILGLDHVECLDSQYVPRRWLLVGIPTRH